MEQKLTKVPRPTRRRLKRLTRKARDPLVVRRALALLRLMQGLTVVAVARSTETARCSVQRWKYLFLSEGEAGANARRPRPETEHRHATLNRAAAPFAQANPARAGLLAEYLDLRAAGQGTPPSAGRPCPCLHSPPAALA